MNVRAFALLTAILSLGVTLPPEFEPLPEPPPDPPRPPSRHARERLFEWPSARSLRDTRPVVNTSREQARRVRQAERLAKKRGGVPRGD